MDDRERAIRWYHDDQGDVNGLAAEFAAVREPLERRVAQLEAALRKWNESHEAYETAIGEDPGLVSVWLRKADALRYDASVLTRAALAVTAVANPGSAGIAEPTQEPEG